MKVFVALCLLFVCVSSIPTFDVELDGAWALFKTKFEKQYTADEEIARRLAWEANVEIIRKHNLLHDMGLRSFTMGLNKYADLSIEEIRRVMNTAKVPPRDPVRDANRRLYVAPANYTRPDWIDWSQRGYVTGVKDQGQCGSCWAFSSTGALEGQHFGRTGQMVSLSEQNLVDCTLNYGNSGCNGGWMGNSFNYIQANGGVDTEDSYPYETRVADCRFNPGTVGATDTGSVGIASQDENALQDACGDVGPIAVTIDASHSSFAFYKDGLYDEPACSSTNLDHAVLLVGYGVKDGRDCYIVKNSWGSSWGTGGYILMSRNNNNQCGIATAALYPTV